MYHSAQVAALLTHAHEQVTDALARSQLGKLTSVSTWFGLTQPHTTTGLKMVPNKISKHCVHGPPNDHIDRMVSSSA